MDWLTREKTTPTHVQQTQFRMGSDEYDVQPRDRDTSIGTGGKTEADDSLGKY